jgi:hypothetical protein
MLSNPKRFRRGAGRFAARGKQLRMKARLVRGRTTAAAYLGAGAANNSVGQIETSSS